MTALVDSEAHFNARAKEYGVTDHFLAQLQQAGISTMGSLAFAINRPGTEFKEQDFDNWLQNVDGGRFPSLGPTASMRRLHFESEIVVTQSFRATVESSDPTPKPVPFAEKNARLDAIRARLGGLRVFGAMEPSQSLLDEVTQQYDLRTLKHVEASRCTSKEHEVSAGRTTKQVKIDGNSYLSVKETKVTPEETISTTYQLSQCFKRRGVAYDFANLITFDKHEAYCDRLLRHLTTEPPAMYSPTTIAQVLRADKAVFTYLSQRVKDIRPDAAGDKPLDSKLMEALQDYGTSFHLMPLPKEAAGGYQPWRDRQTGGHDSSSGQPSKSKGKGKTSKGKSEGSNAAPKGFAGCVGRDNRNRPICFNFNLGSCTAAPRMLTKLICQNPRSDSQTSPCQQPTLPNQSS